ncbi:6-phosphofructokinase [Corchorus capsularis]|uniref:6-phosphofructokinase n=1 Tax=Corchorus capsularis TaxID=210143 RepID=A0A1R3JIK5_COCAP|nr:6-phosphofructokinase [Corchorus capsularis]
MEHGFSTMAQLLSQFMNAQQEMQQQFMNAQQRQMCAQQQQFELLKLSLGGKLNAEHREPIVEIAQPVPNQFTHTELSKSFRTSVAIENQAADEDMTTEEILAKLESSKHDLPTFDLDEADEPCIVVHKDSQKEDSQIKTNKE